jgi:hypothetical protein
MEMTPADVKTRISQILHRSDLAAQLPNWVNDANERINRRFGIELVVPADDAPLPAGTYQLYLFAGLVSGYEHLNNGDNARYYDGKWELEADRQNVLQPGTVTDNYAADPPFIAGV